MEFGFFNIIEIIGALAFFIYGMKIMSDGIQRAAGTQLRSVLRSMTKNKYLGVLTGFTTTAALQSSSATTVMTVSFVNAGLITLKQSVGIMMGANIGTTITAWIISSEFEISLHQLSLPLIAIGVILFFRSVGKARYWGEFLIGFSILFLSISFLQQSVPDINEHSELLEWVKQYSEYGVLSSLLFVFIGALVTIILQSSSAAMALTLTMCIKGWMPFETAAAMVLGENIGTTITAEIASLVGNTDSRRSARIHSLFNVIGVTWMILILPYFLKIVAWFTMNVLGESDPFTNIDGVNYALSTFHTMFNLANVLLLLPFAGGLIYLATKSIRSGDDEESIGLKYIGTRIRTPELSMGEIRNEILRFVGLVSDMNLLTEKLLNTVEKKKQHALLKSLKKHEKMTDRLEQEIVDFITKLSREEMTADTSQMLRINVNICSALEQMGDLYYVISKEIQSKIDDKIWFTPEQRAGINQLIAKMKEPLKRMYLNVENLDDPKAQFKIAEAFEEEIDILERKLRSENIKMMGQSETNVQSIMIYNNLVFSLEKISNLILSVSAYLVKK